MLSETDPQSPPPSATLISLLSVPPESPETTGTQTPPLQTPISIPFRWEEAPGKPREDHDHPPKPKAVRSLDLPPARQGSEEKISNSPSPTTVLDWPDPGMGLGVTHTLSFSFGKLSFRSPEGGMMGSSRRQIGKDVGHGSHRWNFGSWRWGMRNEAVADGGNLDFLKSVIVDEEVGCNQFELQGDSSSSSSSRKTKKKASLFLANIYESFKHVVPWWKKYGSSTKQRA